MVLIVAGGLNGGNVGAVGNAGGAVGGGRIFRHNDLGAFGRGGGIVGQLAVGSGSREIIGSANSSDLAVGIDAEGLKAEAVGGGIGPGAGGDFGAGSGGVAGSIGKSQAIALGERVVLVGHDLITIAVGRGDRNSVKGGSANIGNKSPEGDVKVANGKSKVFESVVDILETGFENIAGGSVAAGSELADSVGDLKTGRGFFAGSNIKIAPFDAVVVGRKRLSFNFFGKN